MGMSSCTTGATVPPPACRGECGSTGCDTVLMSKEDGHCGGAAMSASLPFLSIGGIGESYGIHRKGAKDAKEEKGGIGRLRTRWIRSRFPDPLLLRVPVPAEAQECASSLLPPYARFVKTACTSSSSS